jgi:hypothetical protein
MRHPPGTRLRCEVPFCPKTRKVEHGTSAQWLCADHWRLVPRILRAFQQRRRRREMKDGRVSCLFLCEDGRHDDVARLEAARSMTLCLCSLCSWRRCVDAAIQISAGISTPATLVRPFARIDALRQRMTRKRRPDSRQSGGRGDG